MLILLVCGSVYLRVCFSPVFVAVAEKKEGYHAKKQQRQKRERFQIPCKSKYFVQADGKQYQSRKYSQCLFFGERSQYQQQPKNGKYCGEIEIKMLKIGIEHLGKMVQVDVKSSSQTH
jgi:hypothetical protein